MTIRSNNGTRNLDPALTQSEIGQLKEAIGRLYKEFNDFKISQKAEREQDRAELKAWAETNLIQTKLLNKQTAVIELLTQELKNKENSWQQSEQNSETLLKELALLKKQLQTTPKPSPQIENLELKGLKSSVSALTTALGPALTKLESISQQTKSVPTTLKEERTRAIAQTVKYMQSNQIGDWRSNWSKHRQEYVSLALAGLFLFFTLSWLGGQIFPPRTPDETLGYLQEIWNRTGWTNTKLQRIEKKQGTATRQ